MDACRCCGFWIEKTTEICPVCGWSEGDLEQARQAFLELSGCGEMTVDQIASWHHGVSSPIAKIPTEHIIGAVHRLVAGDIPTLEGCFALALRVSSALPDDPLLLLATVARKRAEVPSGAIRSEWSPQALARRDAEWTSYQREVHETVVAAGRKLLAQLARYRILHNS